MNFPNPTGTDWLIHVELAPHHNFNGANPTGYYDHNNDIHIKGLPDDLAVLTLSLK